ncbi:NMCC_0638 family (lipo)protein [Pseudoduganella lutea]|uniref:DUF4019 domain-containing protein n=1 Tax=Pseudoduganella lutea TaxID=321985 RepID=A0A4P6L198_9BURK|nr:hypothetical protein [Pseudoduganella lutea]QBE65097.1 hypothetical protein EWM63_20605 [Pseudoduganella lutea]
MKHRSTAAMAVLLGVLGTAAAEAPDVPSKAFVDLCMSTFGNPDAVRTAALGRGFKAAPEFKERLMRKGGEGDVYAARDLALVVERGRRMCTVFAKSDNPEATGAHLKSWLPPASTPFTVATENVSGTGNQSTVMYRISKEGKPFAAWTFSTYKGQGTFNVAITLQ